MWNESTQISGIVGHGGKIWGRACGQYHNEDWIERTGKLVATIQKRRPDYGFTIIQVSGR